MTWDGRCAPIHTSPTRSQSVAICFHVLDRYVTTQCVCCVSIVQTAHCCTVAPRGNLYYYTVDIIMLVTPGCTQTSAGGQTPYIAGCTHSIRIMSAAGCQRQLLGHATTATACYPAVTGTMMPWLHKRSSCCSLTSSHKQQQTCNMGCCCELLQIHNAMSSDLEHLKTICRDGKAAPGARL